MEIDKIFVLIGSITLSIAIYWYFLSYKEKAVTVISNSVDILVQGGYKPQNIVIKSNQPTRLNFLRKDPSDCLQEVVLPDFGKRAFLPLNEKVTIEIKPTTPGDYEISCGMNMFHGRIIVEE